MSKVKKVYFSILAIILFTFIFGTVTYAWISLADISSLDGLSLTATTGEHLEISLDGQTFSTTIDGDHLKSYFENVTLNDLTSRDGITFYQGGLRERLEAIPNQEYISFDLWFRTTEVEKHIYLVDNINHLVSYQQHDEVGTFVISRGVRWVAKHTFLNGPNPIEDMVQRGSEDIYFASDAIRISVIEQQNELNPFDQREEHELQRLIYDPSENPERGFGKHYGAFHYFMIASGLTNFRLPTYTPPTVYELTQFAPYDPYQAIDNNSLVAELIPNGEYDQRGRAYYVGKVTVNIWIEGWDADAFDAIHRDRVVIGLAFKSGKPFIEPNNGFN